MLLTFFFEQSGLKTQLNIEKGSLKDHAKSFVNNSQCHLK